MDVSTFPVVVALISALASIAISVLTAMTARRNARDLEKFKAELDQQLAERSARRDYEYEARKGLYHRVEPLRFRMLLAAESGYSCVAGLARTARSGNLTGPKSWLGAGLEGYYPASTTYRLMVPCALARRLQHELTLVDFSLDPLVRLWFVLARMIPETFGADFELAHTAPRTQYSPDSRRPDVSGDAGTWVRQGVFRNRIEDAADAMIARADEGGGLITFGDFQRAFDQRDARSPIAPVAGLFAGFHPALRPVTWRVLLAEAHLHHAMMMLRSIDDPHNVDWRRLVGIPWEDRHAFDWRSEQERRLIPDEDVLEGPFTAAQDYLVARLDRATALLG